MSESRSSPIRAVVLAAGKGTRMRSARPKVLHELCGKPMLWHVLRVLYEAGIAQVSVVVNADLLPHVPALDADARHMAEGDDGPAASDGDGAQHAHGGGATRYAGEGATQTILQEPQLGTGHAVSVALSAFEPRDGARVLVLNGDMPLVGADIVRRTLAADGALALVTAHMPLPSSFGRVVRDGERVTRVVEARDASDDERSIDEMNAGLYAFDEMKLRRALAALNSDNVQGEYYLTDTVGTLAGAGERITPVVENDYRSVLGINDRVELAAATAVLRGRLCERYMRAGVTIVDPATTYLEPDLAIAADVTILPNTALGRRSRIGAHSEIGPNARLENARIGEHVVVRDSLIADSAVGDFSQVGPWANVRGGTEIGTGSRIGNFVEVKAAALAPGVKAAHLTYIGDAVIGERSNLGAGTITCNYDGEKKHRTTIGKDVFIGSNSSLVAPLAIGDRAATGAGTVVIRDVAPGERVVGNPARVLPRAGIGAGGAETRTD